MRKTILSIPALIILLALAVPGWADTNTFSPAGNWSDTTKWSLGHVPDVTEDAVINANCAVDSSAVCKTLTVNSGKTLSGSSTLSIGDATHAGAISVDGGATITYSGNLTLNLINEQTCHFGGKTWSGTVTINILSSNTEGYLAPYEANTFGNLVIDWSSITGGDGCSFAFRSDTTVTNNLTIRSYCTTSAYALNRPMIWSSVYQVGSPSTITVNGSVSITGAIDFEDIHATVGKPWDLSGSVSGNCGGNSYITFRSPQTFYLVLGNYDGQFYGNCGVATGGYPPSYATASGGSTSYANIPLPQDTLVVDNNTWGAYTGHNFVFHAGTRTGTVNASGLTSVGNTIGLPRNLYGNVDYSGAGCAPESNGFTVATICPRQKLEGSQVLTLNIPTAQISSQTIYIGESGAGNYATSSLGTIKLLSNLNLGTAHLTDSTLDLNGHTLTCQSAFSSATSKTRTLTDTSATGGGKILTSTTFDGTTLTWLGTQAGTLINSNTGYQFPLNVSAPTASISAATNIAQTTLTGVGSSTDGGGTVTERGILLKAGGTPTTSSYDFKLTSSGTSGAFSGSGMNATGLTANTAYTARAYAINEAGTGYSTTTTYTTLRVAGTFYLSATGTAANIAAATGDPNQSNPPDGNATYCMNPTVHNAGPFVPGDTIYVSDKGGTYGPPANTYDITVYGIIVPSSGTSGNPITYAAVPGETPTFDVSLVDNGSGWTGPNGNGAYQKTAGWDWVRVAWENGVPLHKALNAAAVGTVDENGIMQDWSYDDNHIVTYRPTDGIAPTNGKLRVMFWGGNFWYGSGLNLQNRSNIEVSGLTFDHCASAITHGDAYNTTAPAIIENIKIHDNIINHSYWAIWGSLKDNTVEQNVEIYNNTLSYCNSGISTWTDMGTTGPGYTQHPEGHNIHNNTINHHAMMDSTHSWSWAVHNGNLSDHEGISFQDPVNCTVADNQITTDINDAMVTPEFATRGVYFFITGNAVDVSGNKILRNRIKGKYRPAIYLSSGVLTVGIENNIIACNVMESTEYDSDATAFSMSWDGNLNPATGINYFVNNTINWTNSPGGINNIPIGAGYWTFQNNIVYSSGGVVLLRQQATTPFVFDHNNYYSTGDNNPFHYSDWNYGLTLTQWQTDGYLTDHGPNPGLDKVGSYVRDPKLRASDSALTTSSPCKTSGTPVEGITVISGVAQNGIDGHAFDLTNPAMGAYAQVASVVPPTVTTQAVSSVSVTTATGNGNITDIGDSAVSAWGVVVNTTGTPTTSDTVSSGSGAGTTGAFTAAMTGLTANTLYYARAYATNGADTSYGSQVTFTTLPTPSAPTVSYGGAISFTGTTATGTGYVASDGGASITARGGCWALTANPVASGSHATAAGTTGAYQISITGLSAGTRYHYRPYATNSVGTSYGADIQFVAGTGSAVLHHHKKKRHVN